LVDDEKEPPTSGAFTRFVRALAGAREPGPDLRAEMWMAFRALVRRELRRRRLDAGPPAWIGIYGHSNWQDLGPSGPLAELAQEAYRHVFLKRRGLLEGHVAEGRGIDALVTTSVRHFLHDLLRRHNPLGARVHDVLRSALRQAIEEGDLVIVSGPPQVRAATVVALGETPAELVLATLDALFQVARRLGDEFMPGLVTDLRADRRRLTEVLSRRLGQLESEGIASFRFGDLVAALQADVRARWAALHTPPDAVEEVGPGERAFAPFGTATESSADRIAARQWVDRLLDCVEEQIRERVVSDEVRHYLLRLVGFHRVYVNTGTSPREEDGPDPADKMPSQRALAKLLDIPRARLGEFAETLRGFGEFCRQRLGGLRRQKEHS
jgi:hypothetical protein